MLRKIISGGQTGADQAGLSAGRQLGLETGGTAPPSFMTDEGCQPDLLIHYGLKEGAPDIKTYPKRTRRNVLDSHGTVWFGRTSSPGGKLTLGLCNLYHRPYLVNPTSKELCDWVKLNNVEILNVAGNRERTNRGIYEKTIETIILAFKEVK